MTESYGICEITTRCHSKGVFCNGRCLTWSWRANLATAHALAGALCQKRKKENLILRACIVYMKKLTWLLYNFMHAPFLHTLPLERGNAGVPLSSGWHLHL